MKKAGFTLIELAIALGVSGSIALVDYSEDRLADTQDKARSLGNEIFKYDLAVSRFLAANAGDATVAGTYIGSNWLKDGSCAGGVSPEPFLDCLSIPSGSTRSFGISPTTVVTSNPASGLAARTVWGQVRGIDGNPDTMSMGMAAMVASGNYLSQLQDAPAAYQGPTVYCPDLTGMAPEIAAICGATRNQIVSTSSISPTTDIWLRTDHQNAMRASLEFSTDGSVTDESSLKDADDRSNSSWLRQISGVARIFNQPNGGQSLSLGSNSGDSIYSDAFLTSNSLLQDAIIVDANLAVMQDVYVKANAFIDGDVEVAGDMDVEGDIYSDQSIRSLYDITSGRDTRSNRNVVAAQNVVSSGGDIIAYNGDIRAPNGSVMATNISADNDVRSGRDLVSDRNVRANSDITSNGDISAQGSMRAGIFYDKDNSSKYINPSSRSQVSSITASSDIRATRFYDQNNTYYYTDPSSTSRVNGLDVRGRITANEYLRLNRTVSPGGGCSPNGLVGKTSSGQIASCVSGRWQASGGASGLKGMFKAYAGQTITCRVTGGTATNAARVLSDGTPQVKVKGKWVDAKTWGWGMIEGLVGSGHGISKKKGDQFSSVNLLGLQGSEFNRYADGTKTKHCKAYWR